MKMKQSEASLSDKASLNNSGQTPVFELRKYSTSISNFFDSLSVRSEVKSNGFPHVVSLTHTEITHDNRVKKIEASIAMRARLLEFSWAKKLFVLLVKQNWF